MEGTIGVVTCFGADWAPKNWASCNGQILPIAQNQALFSILGTTYGGNGQTTFALPDLRGRTAVSAGQGQGLQNYTLGQSSGSESVTMTIASMPAHVHNGSLAVKLDGNLNPGDQTSAEFAVPASFTGAYNATPTPGATTLPPAYSNIIIGTSGGGQPFSNLSPYLAINYIICLYGIFPSRN
jgi:microcystin-dependent protein